MTPQERKVMELALEALERYQVKRQDFERFADVIAAIKEALAQPKQEPEDLTIAYMAGLNRGKDLAPQRKPLTNSEIRKWWASENGLEDCYMAKLDDFEQVIRAVEGKHGIKEST